MKYKKRMKKIKKLWRKLTGKEQRQMMDYLYWYRALGITKQP